MYARQRQEPRPGHPSINPEVCGAGYFVFRGIEGDAGAAHGGAYIIATYDSRSGNSVGYLLEGGVGPVSLGYEKSLSPNSGTADSTKLLFIGKDFKAGPVKASAGGFGGYTN